MALIKQIFWEGEGLTLGFIKTRLISAEIWIFESPVIKILVEHTKVTIKWSLVMFCLVLLCKINVVNGNTKWIQEVMLYRIRKVCKYYLSRNNFHILILPLHNIVITQILVPQTRKLLYMTQLKIQNDYFLSYRFCLFLHC